MTDDARSAALPLPEIDHLTVGDLGHRIRSLPTEDLRTLLDHERSHAARPAVVQLLETRLAEVEGGAPLSSGDATAPSPGTAGASGGSTVSPATSGPPLNPPSHGDPTNPAQPR